MIQNKYGLLAFILFVTFSSFAEETSVLVCKAIPDLIRFPLHHHMKYETLTRELKTRTVTQFIKRIDPSKTLLLQSDVAALNESLMGVFDSMEKNDCSPLDAVSSLLTARVKENLAFAKKTLTDKYKLDESAELQTDIDKRPYATDGKSKEELLLKNIHFQMLSQILAKTSEKEARKNVFHSYELAEKRIRERTARNYYSYFVESFTLGLDPHSEYMPPETFKDFEITMRLKLEGIGATLSSQDGFTVIEELIPGGAADRTKKLKPKDKIIAVGQGKELPVSVTDMDLSDVVRKIRGPKGTTVKLTILRQGPTVERFDILIVRDVIKIEDQAAKITYQTLKSKSGDKLIGIIDLPSFYGSDSFDEEESTSITNVFNGRVNAKNMGPSSFRDMRRLVREAKAKKVDGLILDLSRNGGGLLDHAVKIAGLFLREGAVVATKGRTTRVEVLSDRDDRVEYGGPLVVLTSRYSASASEILAGALKDYRRALIVGADHTFGKGSIQALMSVEPFGVMKVTTGMYFIPHGSTTQNQGVISDIPLPSTASIDEMGENSMDYSLEPEKISSFIDVKANSPSGEDHWIPVETQTIDQLTKLSQKRVSSDPKFQEIVKDLEEIKANKGVLKLSEMRKRAAKENKDSKKEKKRGLEKLKETQAPALLESVRIMQDWLELSQTKVGK